MVDFEKANETLTRITSFNVGITAVVLVLSITLFSQKFVSPTSAEIGAESVTIILLLMAIMFHYIAASTLVSAYYESGPTVEVSVKRARKEAVLGVVLTFWALSALLLAAFDFTVPAISYSIVAALAPFVWLGVRARQSRLKPVTRPEN